MRLHCQRQVSTAHAQEKARTAAQRARFPHHQAREICMRHVRLCGGQKVKAT